MSCEKKKKKEREKKGYLLDYCIHGQGHREGSKCQCLSRYLLNAKTFTTNLGIVMHYHELECHTKRLASYFQGQGHTKGSSSKYDSFKYILWTADSFATKTLFESTLS